MGNPIVKLELVGNKLSQIMAVLLSNLISRLVMIRYGTERAFYN